MSEQIRKIERSRTLKTIINPQNISNEQANKMVSRITDAIELELQQDKLSLNFTKDTVNNQLIEPNAMRRHIDVDEFEKAKKIQKLEKIDEEKRLKQLQLKKLQRQEEILKKSILIRKDADVKSQDSPMRSRVTEEIIQKTKKALSKNKEFQRLLRKKEIDAQLFLQQCKKQEENLRQMEKKEKCEERKKILLEKRKEIQKRIQQRNQSLKKSQQAYQKIKNTKTLFQKIQQEWIKKQKIEQTKINHIKSQLRKAKTMKIQQIQEHQKKYLQKAALEKQKRQQNKNIQRNTGFTPHAYSKYYELARRQEKQKEQQEKQKEKQKQQNIAKKKQFNKFVKQVIFPKIHVEQKQEGISQRILQTKSLDYHQSNKLGNLYMKLAHNQLSPTQNSKKMTTNQNDKSEEPVKNSVIYKNYLQQLKKQSSTKQNAIGVQKQMERLLRNKNMTQSQKLIKSKLLIQKSEQKRKLNEKDMISNIRSKILVLKQILN